MTVRSKTPSNQVPAGFLTSRRGHEKFSCGGEATGSELSLRGRKDRGGGGKGLLGKGIILISGERRKGVEAGGYYHGGVVLSLPPGRGGGAVTTRFQLLQHRK